MSSTNKTRSLDGGIQDVITGGGGGNVGGGSSASQAEASAQNALVSEQNALASAQNALTSEQNALASEQNALASEQSASASADVCTSAQELVSGAVVVCTGSASSASGSASSASSSATNASTSATNASTSATNANSSRISAQNSATNAETSETNALTYRNQAQTARDTTLGYKDTTLGYRNQAQTSATNAEASETNASTARNQAVNARDTTLGYRDTTLGYRDEALAFRNATQTARDTTLGYRNTAQTTRDEAVSARDTAVSARNSAQSSASSSATSAGNSASSATASAGSATASAGSATLAGASATASAGSATASAGSATASAGSAISASESADLAELNASASVSFAQASASSAYEAQTFAENAVNSIATSANHGTSATSGVTVGVNTQTLNLVGSTVTINGGSFAVSGTLLSVNNLSDVESVSTSRTNLGLGSLATKSSIVEADISGTIASTKISGLATVATSGAYNDLSGKPTLGSLALKNNLDNTDIFLRYPPSPMTTSPQLIEGITYTVSASSVSAGTVVQAYNQNIADGYTSTTARYNTTTGAYVGTATTGSTLGEHTTFQLSTALAFQSYDLSIFVLNRSPRIVFLFGSQNGTTWTQLHSVTDLTWSASIQTRSFSFNNQVAFLYYRLVVNAIVPTNGGQLSISDISYYTFTPTALGRLVNAPLATAGTAQVQADWTQATTSSPAFILNKPALGALALLNTVGDAQVSTGISATKISTGVLALAQIPTLDAGRIPNLDTAKITTGTFVDARIPNLDTAKVTTGTFLDARIPNLDTAKITTGTFVDARIPALDTAKITTGTFVDARIPNLATSKITSGIFDILRIPTLDTTRIPALDTSKITTGIFDILRIPDISTAKITSGIFDILRIPNLDTAKITTGIFDVLRIPNLASTKITGLGSLATKSTIVDADILQPYPPAGITLTPQTINGITYTMTTSTLSAGTAQAVYNKNLTDGFSSATLRYNTSTGGYTGSLTTGSVFGEYTTLQLSHPIAFTRYDVSVSGTDLPRSPRIMYLFGSVDGTTWVQLNIASTLTWTAGAGLTKSFTFTNATQYFYYRTVINSTQINNASGAGGITDISFFGSATTTIILPDWNATTGISRILNKPTLGALALLSTVGNSQITDVDAGKINAGTLALSRIPTLDASKVSSAGRVVNASHPRWHLTRLTISNFSASSDIQCTTTDYISTATLDGSFQIVVPITGLYSIKFTTELKFLTSPVVVGVECINASTSLILGEYYVSQSGLNEVYSFSASFDAMLATGNVLKMRFNIGSGTTVEHRYTKWWGHLVAQTV